MNIVLVLVAAGALAYAAYVGSQLLQRRFAGNPLLEFQALDAVSASSPAWSEQMGNALAHRLPISADEWQGHIDWAHRGGKYQSITLGKLTFIAALTGMVGVLFYVMHPSPVAMLAPVVTFIYPFVRIRSAADTVRRRTERQLPELASLVAAELSAGVPPEDALTRAAELPGVLSGLLLEAVRASRQTGKPLLSHGAQTGALQDVFASTRLPALRAFAVQLDLAAGAGVEAPERMAELSQTLGNEYRLRLTEQLEKLESKLTAAVSLFYFAPMIGLILVPLLSEAANAF